MADEHNDSLQPEHTAQQPLTDAPDAQHARDRARVDAGDPDDAVPDERVVERLLGAPVRHDA